LYHLAVGSALYTSLTPLTASTKLGILTEEVLRNETRRGLEVLRSGESLKGVRRCVEGHERHGKSDDF
jgi:hypothetical protein